MFGLLIVPFSWCFSFRPINRPIYPSFVWLFDRISVVFLYSLLIFELLWMWMYAVYQCANECLPWSVFWNIDAFMRRDLLIKTPTYFWALRTNDSTRKWLFLEMAAAAAQPRRIIDGKWMILFMTHTEKTMKWICESRTKHFIHPHCISFIWFIKMPSEE